MARLSLSAGNIEFIRNNHLTMTGADIAKALGVLKGVVHTFQRKNGLSTPKCVSISCRVEKQKLHTTATQEQDDFIKANYLEIPIKTMEKIIGRSSTFIITRMNKLGLIIPAEIIRKRKLESRIKPGIIKKNH